MSKRKLLLNLAIQPQIKLEVILNIVINNLKDKCNKIQTIRTIRKLMCVLDEREKTLFILRSKNLTFKEIANKMNITVRSVFRIFAKIKHKYNIIKVKEMK